MLLIFALSTTAAAQDGHPSTHPSATQNDMSMNDQLAELRAEIARLEAALQQNHQGEADPGSSMGSMSGMGDKGMMDGMGMGGMADKGDKGAMGQSMKSGMSMKGSEPPMQMGESGRGMEMGKKKGMKMMGMMKGADGTQGMTMNSTLPGFPGASHVYHIGASGFFLDHNEHIELTTDQKAALSQHKEQCLLSQNTVDRKIDEAEQQLWELTASDEPDEALIEAKIREIEKLRGDQRLEFIRAVGEAAKVLTADQRKSLLGQGPQQPPTDAKQHQH
tara:strand:- start:505 stop:1332 length:828 start_codon:yes stop_codon:yes gene_type:complete